MRRQAFAVLLAATLVSAFSLPSILNPIQIAYVIRAKLINITDPYILMLIHKVNEEKGWGLPPSCERAVAKYVTKVLLSPSAIYLIKDAISLKLHCNCTIEEALIYTIMEKMPPSVLAKCLEVG